ncbi:MAG: tetratricopeptide repeat protein [Thermodesulfovibrionales bacterium]|jgi:tetratricopeptide (TPR) repeat protein
MFKANGEGLQLDLFSWDQVKTGEGFCALENLDLKKAVIIFEDILSKWEGHPAASAGLKMAVEWDNALGEIEGLPKDDAVISLWEKVRSYTFGQCDGAFRRALIKRAIVLLEDDHSLHIPVDLYLGDLYLEIEDYEKAEQAYRRFIERHSADGRTLGCLGNCLWRQGKKGEARVTYAKALLLVPWEVELAEIDDKELVDALVEEDIYSAAVYGWLRRVLPFVDVEVETPHDSNHGWSLLVYQTLRHAEKARVKGDHEGMVEQRRLLKEVAPAVFLEYMGRI